MVGEDPLFSERIYWKMYNCAVNPFYLVSASNLPVKNVGEQMKEWLLNNLGGEFTPNSPEEFSAFLASDAAHWQKVIKQIGLQPD